MTVEGSTATLDFGPVVFGDDAVRHVRIVNGGRGALRVIRDPVGTPPFVVAAFAPELAAGAELELLVHFAPPISDEPTGQPDYSSRLQFQLEDSVVPSLTLVLRGRGVVECALPDELDFGNVRIGEMGRREVLVSNPTSAPISLMWEPPDLVLRDAPFFAWSEPAGSLVLAPGERKNLTATFVPVEVRQYLTTVRVELGGRCPVKLIHLKGAGVSEYLGWTPAKIECGWVPVGAEKRLQVQLENLGAVPVNVAELRTTGELGLDSSQMDALALLPGARSVISVRCLPVDVGVRRGALEFVTSLASLPSVAIPGSILGGGPRVSVLPSSLDFGSIAYFPGTSFETTRFLVVKNVGVFPFNAESSGNLHLATTAGGSPFLVASGQSSSEVSVSVGAYDPDAGLRADHTDELLAQVHLVPNSAGPKDFIVQIATDDVVTPIVNVPATAMAIAATPCQFAVTPGTLDFGRVVQGEAIRLRTTLTNTGTASGGPCYMSDLDVDAFGRGVGFSLVGGRVDSLVLAPGESRAIDIQVEPPFGGKADGVFSSTLSFRVSNPLQPHGEVLLKVRVGPKCLVASPSPIDFGSAPVGCRKVYDVDVHNICSSSYSLGPAVVDGVGFGFVGDGGTPPSVAPNEAAKILVAFSPFDAGVADGMLRITSGAESFLVPLSGFGASGPLRQEWFHVSPVPRVDIIYEPFTPYADGGTLSDVLASYGRAGELADVAVALRDAGYDFHLGFVYQRWDYLEDSANSPNAMRGAPVFGSLRTPWDAGSPNYVSSNTPSLWSTTRELARAAKNGDWWGTPVQPAVDFSGRPSCIEAALRAITPPLGTTVNAGFLRDAVPLAVVCQIDNGDWSTRNRPGSEQPNSLPLYVQLFKAARGGRSIVTFNGLGELDSSCDPYWYMHDPGSRLATMSQLTGGVTIDVCDGGLVAGLESIKTSIMSLQRRFGLQEAPDLSKPITVQVNGVQSVGWSYSASLNEIELAAPPPANADVGVAYSVLCQ